jgi:uncharacterized protein
MAELVTAVAAALAAAWRRDSAWHGEEHWRCVVATGLMLGRGTPGAELELVFLFGLLHDTRRENEHVDPGHGRRAAEFARTLHDIGALPIDDGRLEVLCLACELHSEGQTSQHPTIGVCWDADRLHLPRVGIDPDPELLSTARARDDGQLEAAAQVRRRTPTWATLISMIP